MQGWQIILVIIIVISILTILYLLLHNKLYKIVTSNLIELVNDKFNYKNIEILKRSDLFNITFNDKKTYLIKLVFVNSKHEIIITNSEKVVINKDIKGWKKSTKPNFVSGIKEFINYKKEESPIKIVVIYPDCYKIIKYTNESDAYIVDIYKKIDGVYYVRYVNLVELLNKL